MKFQVGDLILVKKCRHKSHPHLRRRPHLHLRLRPHLRLHPRLHLDLRLRFRLEAESHLKNTYGVITEAFNHSDAWEGESTEDDNIYFWYSQVDAKTYWFCQNELIEYEVVK